MHPNLLNAHPKADFPAAKCIDGDTEGHSFHDRNMCHTNGEPSPWLAIDYGTTVTVKTVEIFNRDGCCGDRTKNVDVRVSNELPTSDNQMFSGGSLLGHFTGPGTNGQLITITGETLANLIFLIEFQVKPCPADMSLSRWTMVKVFRSI